MTDADQRIHELAQIAIDARLNLADAIREACPKPHAFVQHRDHKPPWCNTCGRGELGTHYRDRPAERHARLARPECPGDGCQGCAGCAPTDTPPEHARLAGDSVEEG